MANNPKNDDFPTIRLDDEDRRDYQKKRQPSSTSSNVSPSQSTSPTASSNAGSKSGNGIWITLIAVFALSACGGCYYLYTLLAQQQNAAYAAEQRIAQLESKLSATGEEIGESTVALQVKVTELSNRTNELWEQMDKLWASAWRRNQKEIADLGARVGNVQNAINASISNVADDVTAQNAEIGSVKSQLATLADEVLALNVQLEQAGNAREQSEQNVRALTDKLKILEQRNTALSGRVSGLENDIRDIATKVVSSSGTGVPPSVDPSALPVN